MILECPGCGLALKGSKLTELGSQIRCPACHTMFAAGAPERVVEPKPERVVVARPDPVVQASTPARKPPRVRPRRARPRKESGSKLPWILGAVGVGSAFVVAGLVLIVWLTISRLHPSGDRDSDFARNQVSQSSTTEQPRNGPLPQDRGRDALSPQIEELFDDSATRPAPQILVPVLNRARGEEFDLPKLSALKNRRNPVRPAAGDGKMSLDEIKKAVVFIRIESRDGIVTGSGFVIRSEDRGGLVATNCHVVAEVLVASRKESSRAPKIQVIFNSGLPAERAAEGEIAAVDVESDLAILRVTGVSPMPRAIDPRFSPEPKETTEVLICGFPFGDALSTNSRSPAVTIGKGSVSSLRRDDAGNLALVQIDGALNPGNSGGPIVDSEGRLVGVSVATIKGAGIGMAIPPGELAGVLEGRVYSPLFLSTGLEDGTAVFQVVVPVMDPLRRIRSVSLHVLKGEARADNSAPGADDTWKPLAGASKLDLTLDGKGLATGPLRFPAQTGASALIQVAWTYEGGESIVSRPVSFRLKVDAIQTGDDAMPMLTLDRSPERFEGKVVVVRGQISLQVVSRGQIRELQVMNEANARPLNLYFVTTREVADQLSEAPPMDITLTARLTCRVGKKDGNGVAAIRVTRIDFLGRGNRVVKTIPSDEGASDPLIDLNRHPERKIGQTVVLNALLTPGVGMRGQEPEYSVWLLTEAKPCNLQFTSSRDIATQLNADRGRGSTSLVRLTGRVEARSFGERRYVTLLKIEYLGPDGEVLKTIQ